MTALINTGVYIIRTKLVGAPTPVFKVTLTETTNNTWLFHNEDNNTNLRVLMDEFDRHFVVVETITEPPQT